MACRENASKLLRSGSNRNNGRADAASSADAKIVEKIQYSPADGKFVMTTQLINAKNTPLTHPKR